MSISLRVELDHRPPMDVYAHWEPFCRWETRWGDDIDKQAWNSKPISYREQVMMVNTSSRVLRRFSVTNFVLERRVCVQTADMNMRDHEKFGGSHSPPRACPSFVG